IWLQVLAALAILEKTGRLAALLVLVAAALTRAIYPSSSYSTGLELMPTAILVARNLLLLLAWGFLLRKALGAAQLRQSVESGASGIGQPNRSTF
ncbi:MAG TPA: hypothetical protein VE782_03480, partial [Myxococcaceae bacterium]|nr:hypothetical protein [Myxococcaceae bacterium]